MLKFLAEGVGTTADAIKAIAYAERMAAGIYRAVVLGVDLQQVADPGARRFLLERILDFVGPGRRDRILLVDDDGSPAPGSARASDVASFYEAALLSLGQAYERVEVPGPALFRFRIWIHSDIRRSSGLRGIRRDLLKRPT